MKILKDLKLKKAGVIHGFYGSKALAQQYISLGYKLGIGPQLLVGDNNKLSHALKDVSLDHIVIETDIPNRLTRTPNKINSACSYLYAICERLSKIHNKPISTIATIVTNNSRALYGLID